MVKCPECKRIILDSTQDGGYKLRSRMVLFKNGKAVALCPTCKSTVEVPVILGDVGEPPAKPKIIVNS
jgi:hypothetical protein